MDLAADNFECGWCGTLSPATSLRKHDAPYPDSTLGGEWHMIVCVACDRPSLELVEWGVLPRQARATIDTAGAPDSARTDYIEAVACLSAGAPRDTATMVRRAVQAICLDLKADPGLTLYRQIEQLHKRGELTNRLERLATRLRLFGNDGAHPSSDGLEKVTAKEAEVAVRFLEHLIEHVYVLDAELAELDDPPAQQREDESHGGQAPARSGADHQSSDFRGVTGLG